MLCERIKSEVGDYNLFKEVIDISNINMHITVLASVYVYRMEYINLFECYCTINDIVSWHRADI